MGPEASHLMSDLDTTLVRRNLERIVADLTIASFRPEGFRERAGRLSRLASEVIVAYEAAFVSSAEMPAAVEMPVSMELPTA